MQRVYSQSALVHMVHLSAFSTCDVHVYNANEGVLQARISAERCVRQHQSYFAIRERNHQVLHGLKLQCTLFYGKALIDCSPRGEA